MSDILKEQQWQQKRAAKPQRVSQPRKASEPDASHCSSESSRRRAKSQEGTKNGCAAVRRTAIRSAAHDQAAKTRHFRTGEPASRRVSRSSIEKNRQKKPKTAK